MLRKLIALALAALMGTAVPIDTFAGTAANATGPVTATCTTKNGAAATATVNGRAVAKCGTAASAAGKKANRKPGRKGVTPPIRRPLYHAFCPGGLPPRELAARIDESYRKDGTGHAIVRGCHADPIQFIEAFNQGDPDAHVTDRASIVRYLREVLVLTKLPEGVEFYSSCLYGKSNGPEDVYLKCEREHIPPNVKVYANRYTGRPVFKQSCANPGLVPVKPSPCAQVLVRIPDGERGKLAISEWGEFTPEEEALCPLSIQGPRQGGERFSQDFGPLGNDSFAPCDWSMVGEYLSIPLHRSGCVEVSSGWYLVRGPLRLARTKETRLVFCFFTDDGHKTYPIGALPETYRRQKDGSMLSTLWASPATVPDAFGPTYMYWRWAY